MTLHSESHKEEPVAKAGYRGSQHLKMQTQNSVHGNESLMVYAPQWGESTGVNRRLRESLHFG